MSRASGTQDSEWIAHGTTQLVLRNNFPGLLHRRVCAIAFLPGSAAFDDEHGFVIYAVVFSDLAQMFVVSCRMG